MKDENELMLVASEFAKKLDGGDVIALEGPLGAGKTTFVKGIAKHLKIDTPITSPTYTISKLYDQKLAHIDAYRISEEDIGIDDLIAENYIIAIEWSQNLGDFLPQVNYLIKIEYTLDGREVTIESLK